MGTHTLSETDRVVQAIWVGIWFGIALLLFFYLTHRGAEGAPMRWERWSAFVRERYLLSSATDEEATDEAPEPGENTPSTNQRFADTDAVRAGTGERTGSQAVRRSRRLTYGER